MTGLLYALTGKNLRLTLNLFCWLSAKASLSGQLQQLPIASLEDHVITRNIIFNNSVRRCYTWVNVSPETKYLCTWNIYNQSITITNFRQMFWPCKRLQFNHLPPTLQAQCSSQPCRCSLFRVLITHARAAPWGVGFPKRGSRVWLSMSVLCAGTYFRSSAAVHRNEWKVALWHFKKVKKKKRTKTMLCTLKCKSPMAQTDIFCMVNNGILSCRLRELSLNQTYHLQRNSFTFTKQCTTIISLQHVLLIVHLDT